MARLKTVKTGELNFYSDLASRGNFEAAPISCFRHVALSRCFERHVVNGLLVEAGYKSDEPKHKTIYWIATVVGKEGSLVRLRFLGAGADPDGDFVRNFPLTVAPRNDQLDERFHPVGWATKNERPFEPPRSIREAHPDWRSFLKEQLASADKVLVDDPHPIAQQGYECIFRPGMEVETTDISEMEALKPAVVVKVIGLRIKFRFLDADGIEQYCWFHEFSNEFFPPGTWSLIGRKINSNKEYKKRTKNKLRRLKGSPGDDDAASSCFEWLAVPRSVRDFSQKLIQIVLPCYKEKKNEKLSRTNGLKRGEQLEVLDRLRPGISVATIVKVLRNGYLLLEIVHQRDRNPEKHEKYRICVYESSDSLLPPGFAARNGLMDYFNAPTRDFQYEKSTMASSEHLLRVFPRQASLFRVGQILEVNGVAGSDQIYVGRITRIVGHLLLIHFEGWGKEHDHFFPMSSVDLYPVGYCHSVGHPLITPTVTQDSKNATKPTRALATSGFHR